MYGYNYIIVKINFILKLFIWYLYIMYLYNEINIILYKLTGLKRKTILEILNY